MTSPLKTTFFQFDLPSTNKKVVSCEINGWMETNAKHKMSNPLPPSKFIRNIQIIHSPNERTNFQKLKERRSTLLKNTLRKFSQRTPLTAQSNQLSSRRENSNNKRSIRLHSIGQKENKAVHIIEISQFKEQQLTSHSQPYINIGQRKISLLRLRAQSKKGVRNNFNHLLLGKQADIIQNKITENQYCGLKFVTRRLTSRLRQ